MSNHLGQLRATSGQAVDARPLHEQARQIFEKLAAAQPRVLDHQVGLGDTYNNLGYLNTFTDRPADGLEWFAQALTKLEVVRQRAPKHQEAIRVLRRTHAGQAEALTKLARHAEAAKELDKAAQLAAGSEQTKYRLRRAAALARAGEHATAAAEGDALADRPGVKGDVLYSLAGVYATAATVKDDPELAGQYASRAMELLGRAQTEGFFKDPANLKRLRDDSDLDPLRPRDEFQQFVRGVEAKEPGPK
jgi:tetratricopeptide (TPR) repeat protein